MCLETDLFYAKYEIGFVMVGADGKPVKQGQSSHVVGPGAVKTGCFQLGGGVVSWALPQDKRKGKSAR